MKNIFRFLFVVFCLFTTTNPLHAQWVQTNGPYLNVTCFAVSPNGVGDTDLFAGSYGGGVFILRHIDSSWTPVDSGLTDIYVHALAVSPNGAGGTNLFAGTNSSGVFLSTNRGLSWTAASIGLTNTDVWSFAVSPNGASGTDLYAGTNGGGVCRSTNSGRSWTAVNNGLIYTGVSALAALGTNIFAGTDNGIFLLAGSDTTWNWVLRTTVVNVLTVSGTNIFAGTDGAGIYLSTNNGTTWTQIDSGLTDTYVNAIVVSGTNLFAGTNSGGVFLSTNSGTSWTAINTGLTNTYVNALAVFHANLFAGTNGSGAWRRPLSQMITSVERFSTNSPTHFSLDQNYPNPFNPTTAISYQLSANSFVSLKVYDILGREVTTLVNEKQSAGSYQVTFDASRLASGVYFYRLTAGSFVSVKKLVLLK